MKIQTITVKNLRRGALTIIAFCLLLTSASAQQSDAKKLPAGARINKNEVIAVQVELRKLGYLKTPITGQLDAGTSEAVKTYQRKNGLPVSGGIDSATYEKLGLPYPAPDPNDPNLVQRTTGAVKESAILGLEKTREAGAYAATKSKEGGRYALEKGWDGGAYVATKSKDAAKASVRGTKNAGRAGGRKAVSIIRRNDDDIYPELAELFFEHHDWNGVRYEVKDGMVSLKIPPKSQVDVGSIVSEVRKIAGVRSVFVISL
jgi:peptidoglycan hydrolase-like protein with peptidoglycan-binding domain